MDIKKVQRTEEPKIRRINLKTTKSASEWMTKHNVSPQRVFDEALKELMKTHSK